MPMRLKRGKKVDITVRNRLKKEKRDISVYHHSDRSTHLISYNNSLTRDIRLVDENDYLHISVGRGPGFIGNDCVMELPSFVDFRFSLSGDVILIHTGERILLRIPPGPPLWELKMKISKQSPPFVPADSGHVTIGDGEEWPGDSLEEL